MKRRKPKRQRAANITKAERADIVETYTALLRHHKRPVSLAIQPAPACLQVASMLNRAAELMRQADELLKRIEAAADDTEAARKVREYTVILARLPAIRTHEQLAALKRVAKRLAAEHNPDTTE